MWFAVYRNDTGALWAIASDIDAGALGTEFGAVPYETRPDLAAVVWDEAQRMFVPRPPAPVQRVLSKRRFMARIPVDHYITLTAIRLNPASPLELRAALETAAELRDMVSEINLDDPGTQQFVPVATDALIAAGRVAAADRAAYIAAWLADPD